MLKVNGVAIATPSVFKVVISDLDGESNRNANGELLRDRIAVKRKLECEWPLLTTSEASTLLQAVQDVFFTVTYPDPMVGGNTTKTFYVGDRSAPMYNFTLNKWQNIAMNFIEK